MNRPMKTKHHKKSLLSAKKNKGFSLVELLISMALSTTIIALASQTLLKVQESSSTSQKKVDINQKMSSVLEIIGREIRQAGELITDADFPTVQVIPLNFEADPVKRPVSLIVYRAISNPISMCTAFPAGANVNQLTFAISTTTNLPCQVLPAAVTGTNIFPADAQAGWVDQRTAAVGGRRLGMVATRPVLPVGSPRTFVPFIYNSEISAPGVDSLNLAVGISPIVTVGATINLTDSAYLVTKKEYVICQSNLIVRTNSRVQSTPGNPACTAPNPITDPTGTMSTVATNIDSLTIKMATRERPSAVLTDPVMDAAAEENSVFPTVVPNVRNWQNIQGVTVNIVSVNPSPGKALANLNAQGTFYPRNALSTK
jgi:prepilin-type N-terminal cleavage/methylation domain-containing protein